MTSEWDYKGIVLQRPVAMMAVKVFNSLSVFFFCLVGKSNVDQSIKKHLFCCDCSVERILNPQKSTTRCQGKKTETHSQSARSCRVFSAMLGLLWLTFWIDYLEFFLPVPLITIWKLWEKVTTPWRTQRLHSIDAAGKPLDKQKWLLRFD